jgi:hypothetical protein
MKDSKLIDLLRTLSPKEFRDLEKFILSPYFRKRDVSGLFNVLKKFYPDFNDVNLNSEFVFNKLYPGKTFDKKKAEGLIRTISSDFVSACKDYFIQIELEEQSSFRDFLLLNQLRKRKLYGDFKKEFITAISDDPDSEKELAIRFIEKSFLYNSAIEYYIDKADYENVIESITKQIEYLIAASVLKSLRFPDQKNIAEEGFNLKLRYNLIDKFSENLNITGLLAEMKKNKDQFTPYIELYYCINQLIVNPSEEKYYFELKKLLLNREIDLPQSEKYMMFSIASAYSHERSFNGIKNFKRETFEMYESMIRLGVYKYSKKDHIAPGLYLSMLIEARICKEFVWMKNLIDNYINEIHPDIRQSIFFYSMGQYYFGVGENEKSLENLIKVKSEYFLFKRDLKNLLFRIYYNLGYFDEAYSILDNMKHYIKSTKELSETFKTRSRNFIKFASGLLKIASGTNKNSAGYLCESIKKVRNTESYNWLLEKAEELK